MRIYANNKGTVGVSMGPVGWLIVGPFLLTAWAARGLMLAIIFLVDVIAARVTARRAAARVTSDPDPYVAVRRRYDAAVRAGTVTADARASVEGIISRNPEHEQRYQEIQLADEAEAGRER